MSTALTISNQSLQVNIDYKLQIKDLYFPHIGQENQLNKYQNRMFFWIDGKFYDTDSTELEITVNYEEHTGIGLSYIESKKLGLKVEVKDYVLIEKNIYIREFTVSNSGDNLRQIRIFFQNNFALLESPLADTVVWHQPSGSLLHYKNRRFLAIASQEKFYQFSCAAKSDNNGLGAVPDENGELKYNPVSTGNVSSCISFRENIAAGEKYQGSYCIAAGSSLADVSLLVDYYHQTNLNDLYFKTKIPWKKLLESELYQLHLPAKITSEKQQLIKDKYWRAIVQMINQIDKNGCVVAANDGQYLKGDGTDSYSYYWPRDGAQAVLALNRLEQQRLAKRCLKFGLELTTAKGYFLHKYLPETENGKPALGSSWHCWLDRQGKSIMPIQEDATALFLLAIIDYYKTFKDADFIKANWRSIEAIIKFLILYNCGRYHSNSSLKTYVTGFDLERFQGFDSYKALPYPSYDIWEQYLGIFTYTDILVLEAIKGSLALVDLAKAKYLREDLIIYFKALKKEILSELVDKESGLFIKGIIFDEKNNNILQDKSADASLICLSSFVTDKDIKDILEKTIQNIIPKLTVSTAISGVARKENDQYLHLGGTYPGNPWMLTSLWLAQKAISEHKLDEALSRMDWVIKHTDATGLMAEQVDPYTGYGIGVKPLTWNQAEYIKTALGLMQQF